MKKRLKKVRFWLVRQFFVDILLEENKNGLAAGKWNAYMNVYLYMKSLYGKDSEEWCAEAWAYVVKQCNDSLK